MRLDADEAVFAEYLEAATAFWRHAVLPAGKDDPCILVELFPEDFRVALRQLTMANALRRFLPAHVVLVTGADSYWHPMLWRDFSADRVRALAAAFGVSEVVDIETLLGVTTESGAPLSVLGRAVLPAAPDSPAQRQDYDFDAIVSATAVRLWRVPRLEPGQRSRPDYVGLRERSELLAESWAALMASLRPIAFITSHVDYNQFGIPVEAARRFDVPVMHMQQTGSLKAYALWPEHDSGAGTFRAEITRQLGEVFDQQLWPLRAELRSSAELVAHRSKYNLGRPSWWRASANSWVQLDNATQREQLRSHVAARFGWDPELPVLTVFNHAVSDAVGTNAEFFADLGSWFERTAEHASGNTNVNWLFLDHPAQVRYDASGFFEALAARHRANPHMVFRPSEALTKNAIWCLTDLGLTVRGSVSNELPAYGIPVLQAGWSEWSACGFSLVATDEQDYWQQLARSIDRLRRDEPVITAEQVDRARLWMWFYRAGADVSSPLLPHWENLTTNEVLTFLLITMRYVESDGDAVFAAVRRMWMRKEPVLTRFDLSSTDDVVGAVLPRVVR